MPGGTSHKHNVSMHVYESIAEFCSRQRHNIDVYLFQLPPPPHLPLDEKRLSLTSATTNYQKQQQDGGDGGGTAGSNKRRECFVFVNSDCSVFVFAR